MRALLTNPPTPPEAELSFAIIRNLDDIRAFICNARKGRFSLMSADVLPGEEAGRASQQRCAVLKLWSSPTNGNMAEWCSAGCHMRQCIGVTVATNPLFSAPVEVHHCVPEASPGARLTHSPVAEDDLSSRQGICTHGEVLVGEDEHQGFC